MSLSLCFNPAAIRHPKQTHPRIPLHKPLNPIKISATPLINHYARFSSSKTFGVDDKFQGLAAMAPPDKPRWENWLSTAASLYPFYVTVGAVVAFLRPSIFSWFFNSGPTSYSITLGFIMLTMGITLELNELIGLFRQRPLSIFYGCAAQYTIMPALGVLISKLLGLSPSLSVTLIAQGDVPLSIVMTVCTTLGAVILTPILSKILAGTLVPVNAVNLSMSTLQVVVAPILLGSYLQSKFPKAVKLVAPCAPLLAVLSASLVACSILSENVIRLKSSVLFGASFSSDLSPILRAQAILRSELGVVVLSVLLLHSAGFFVGYLSAALGGFKEPQRRAISIEVGMQNSSLGVVLATSHFTSPMVALPSATSAVIMNIMGSSLGFFWRYINPSDPKDCPKVAEE